MTKRAGNRGRFSRGGGEMTVRDRLSNTTIRPSSRGLSRKMLRSKRSGFSTVWTDTGSKAFGSLSVQLVTPENDSCLRLPLPTNQEAQPHFIPGCSVGEFCCQLHRTPHGLAIYGVNHV